MKQAVYISIPNVVLQREGCLESKFSLPFSSVQIQAASPKTSFIKLFLLTTYRLAFIHQLLEQHTFAHGILR